MRDAVRPSHDACTADIAYAPTPRAVSARLPATLTNLDHLRFPFSRAPSPPHGFQQAVFVLQDRDQASSRTRKPLARRDGKSLNSTAPPPPPITLRLPPELDRQWLLNRWTPYSSIRAHELGRNTIIPARSRFSPPDETGTGSARPLAATIQACRRARAFAVARLPFSTTSKLTTF
ncbi:RHTO0S01e09516g1_1 [Rhodotorula toruloides]|uniref:RHTO0S01e09516g1_1 n=2 Tax=Rhodotorula toruloides TaxID=5286 RepID=A0A061AMF7_RHOTO|nr:uncharacterized protein RHTO_04833 [Rhodotorula toruloides NP11]EMS24654.1 hypothetical protein RHTO_04833 [Rhodotorula toruloides NP11]CDR35891.1 RHTO0S01e09516g1_1 [Rhodotorula toruloides]